MEGDIGAGGWAHISRSYETAWVCIWGRCSYSDAGVAVGLGLIPIKQTFLMWVMKELHWC